MKPNQSNLPWSFTGKEPLELSVYVREIVDIPINFVATERNLSFIALTCLAGSALRLPVYRQHIDGLPDEVKKHISAHDTNYILAQQTLMSLNFQLEALQRRFARNFMCMKPCCMRR